MIGFGFRSGDQTSFQWRRYDSRFYPLCVFSEGNKHIIIGWENMIYPLRSDDFIQAMYPRWIMDAGNKKVSGEHVGGVIWNIKTSGV